MTTNITSWADEVDDDINRDINSLPEPSTVYEKGMKIVTEYGIDDDNKRIKVVRYFKVEKKMVSKSVAERKKWAKFGDSRDDAPGPNPATTVVAEDVFMQFISSKEEDNKNEEDALAEKLKGMGDKGVVKCRTCGADHWTSKCPYKDTDLALNKIPGEDKKTVTTGGVESSTGPSRGPPGSKYVPPSLREGGNQRGSSMQSSQNRNDAASIRISNLSESTTDQDLEELVRPFGHIQKIYLAKERNTNTCKGFAYVHYRLESEAAAAIRTLNGYGYDHLILSVDWSSPPAPKN